MKKIKKGELNQAVYDLFHRYVHNKISRREFTEQVSVYAVGGLTVTAILDYLLPKYEERQQVAVDDPMLNTELIEYDSPRGAGKMRGQLSRPVKAEKKLPGIVVVHENRGLNPHIADVGRRGGVDSR